MLDAAITERPCAEALSGVDGTYTYAQLDSAVRRSAAALARMGARPGDRVAARSGNETGLVVAFLAVMRIGAVWVGINPALAPPEVEFQLEDSGASVFIGRSDGIRRGDSVRHWVEGVHELAGSSDAEPAPVDIDPFAPAAIAYTSGTTGRPKGAVHSQYNMMVVATGAGGRATPSCSDRVGVCLPLALLNLMILGPLTAFASGAACVLLSGRDPATISKAVLEDGVTTMAVVPTVLHDLLTDPGVDTARLLATFTPTVGGSDCPPAWRRLFAGHGLEVNQTYGLTEAPTAVTAGVPGQPDGSSGRPLPHIEFTIRDGDGRVLPAGREGQICIAASTSGPHAGVYRPMLGYWGDPAASEAALSGGVLHTGDLGHLDDGGFLFVHDRGDDLILRGGANVYPAEVERVIAGLPGVAGVAVVGVADDRLGQRVVAAVEAVPGESLTEASLAEACERELGRYKVPERFVIVDSLPRTSMGKIRRNQIRFLFRQTPEAP